MPQVKVVPRGGGEGEKPTFVDAFAGCGGLSLGLKRAGWRGVFAIEKDAFAFKTLTTNFPDGGDLSYSWPESIEKRAWDVRELLDTQGDALRALEGTVDLLAGGPPCQGFSHAGRRNADDPRNVLFEAYLELVDVLKPNMVLLENVRGFQSPFRSRQNGEVANFAQALNERLSADYYTVSQVIQASDLGVPQVRQRFFLIGCRKEGFAANDLEDFFPRLMRRSRSFLLSKGLQPSPSSRAAISDLTMERNGTVPSDECPRFKALAYKGPLTALQQFLRDGAEGPPSDTRLARHAPHIEERFRSIITSCVEEGRLNVSISKELREKHGLKKMAIRVMDPLRPAPTITSLPDDLLHYAEPRTLTVRENARLQTFPDWFSFHGKYTTGGHLRRKEVPRFTQVANAVPPLLAEQLGLLLRDILKAGDMPVDMVADVLESIAV